MSTPSKTIGLLMVGAGFIIALGAVFCLLPNVMEGKLQWSGFALGVTMAFFFVGLPLVGVGIYVFTRGRAEAAQLSEVAKERRLLSMMQAQGRVNVRDAALELDVPLSTVKEYIYDLVHKGIFVGYINWDEGVLYSKQASEMQTTRCPHCGGERELVGKGIVKCPYCGSELFL
jgi:hypothetical protein